MVGVTSVFSVALLLVLASVAQTGWADRAATAKVYYVHVKGTYYVWVKVDKIIFPNQPDAEIFGVKYQVDDGAFQSTTGQRVASCDPSNEPQKCKEYSETWTLVAHFSTNQPHPPTFKYQEFIRIGSETKMGKKMIVAKWPKKPEKIPNVGLDRFEGVAWRKGSNIEGSVTFTIMPLVSSLGQRLKGALESYNIGYMAKIYARPVGDPEFTQFPVRVKELKPVGPVDKVLGFGYEIWESTFSFANVPRSKRTVEIYVEAAIQETGGVMKKYYKNQEGKTPFVVKVGRKQRAKAKDQKDSQQSADK